MISCIHDSPIGPLTLHSNGAALTGLEFDEPRYPLPSSPPGEDAVLAQARRELDAYFAGKLRAFSVPLAPTGTPFQLKVWMALRAIPYGATRSYGQQAAAIGQPKAVRAVGLANGKNPISIIVPCHRVIGAGGALTGFGGGLARKQALLDLEQRQTLLR
ncbi:MAG: methylated-DNA--[protein]-cysteine S-methyltransferase [Hyphomonadaceae bacterium]|nr:methylated-DNA--[protein]-cysteine S-methyltransferase [Hyphomonadaceae bacterium]